MDQVRSQIAVASAQELIQVSYIPSSCELNGTHVGNVNHMFRKQFHCRRSLGYENYD